MAHYSGRSFEYDEKALERMVAIKVKIESMTGKKG
jgi:hypothetical protein